MVLGIGGVAGIGFTISLFIAELAFTDPVQTELAALAILVAGRVGRVRLRHVLEGSRSGGGRSAGF